MDDVMIEIDRLKNMTAGELRTRYAEVFGEPARSGNRQWLYRRVAWRIQANAYGGLSERALERARELARDADIRFRPPTGQITPPPLPSTVVPHDRRIPPPGSVLTRVFKGREHKVTVRGDGFEYAGHVYRSLTAVAHAISGSHWNGLLFFGLATREKSA
ncbi:MAG: DUF2924 domain-containing protein [Phycisphaerales bacterium]|nr:DUF2924 domain-containing protein [Phycisphaerales bacterium]